MSFVSVTVPTQTRQPAAPKISPEDMKKLLQMLHKGESVSDDTVYSKVPEAKMGARDRAYYAGEAVRREVLAADQKLTAKELGIRTWEVDGGFKWALRIK